MRLAFKWRFISLEITIINAAHVFNLVLRPMAVTLKTHLVAYYYSSIKLKLIIHVGLVNDVQTNVAMLRAISFTLRLILMQLTSKWITGTFTVLPGLGNNIRIKNDFGIVKYR